MLIYLLLLDFLIHAASFLHIRAPVIYAQRDKASKSELQDGMNFARGGSGVLDVSFNNYSMTLQVRNFKEQIAREVYTKADLGNSIALVSYTGNDYIYKSISQKGTMNVSASTRLLSSFFALSQISCIFFCFRNRMCSIKLKKLLICLQRT